MAPVFSSNTEKCWTYSNRVFGAKNRFVKIKVPFVEKTKAIKKFDANFDSDVYIFEDKFLGEFKVKSKKDTILSMSVTYMICNEVMCLPPIDETLSIKLDTNE